MKEKQTDLTSEQLLAINVLAQSDLKDKFYWSGGTLLSHVYLHHRKSVDIDFFSDEHFGLEKLVVWADNFCNVAKFSEYEERRIHDRNEFIFKKKDYSLRVEFVYYNHTKKPINRNREKYEGVYIDSLEDIAANKFFAFFDRSEPKDLLDLYFLINLAERGYRHLN